MAINYKILGQSHPAAATDTDLYTCPASTQTVVSSITVANVTAVTGYARVYVRKAGAATSNVYAIIFDAVIPGNTTSGYTLGITLEATDVITVRSTNGSDLTFHAYGSEIV